MRFSKSVSSATSVSIYSEVITWYYLLEIHEFRDNFFAILFIFKLFGKTSSHDSYEILIFPVTFLMVTSNISYYHFFCFQTSIKLWTCSDPRSRFFFNVNPSLPNSYLWYFIVATNLLEYLAAFIFVFKTKVQTPNQQFASQRKYRTH